MQTDVDTGHPLKKIARLCESLVPSSKIENSSYCSKLCKVLLIDTVDSSCRNNPEGSNDWPLAAMKELSNEKVNDRGPSPVSFDPKSAVERVKQGKPFTDGPTNHLNSHQNACLARSRPTAISMSTGPAVSLHGRANRTASVLPPQNQSVIDLTQISSPEPARGGGRLLTAMSTSRPPGSDFTLHVCRWNVGTSSCGQVFLTADQLNKHVLSHAMLDPTLAVDTAAFKSYLQQSFFAPYYSSPWTPTTQAALSLYPFQNPSVSYYMHMMMMEAATRRDACLPPSVPTSVSSGGYLTPHVCNWNFGTSSCGQMFSTADELMVHLRSHVMLSSDPTQR